MVARVAEKLTSITVVVRDGDTVVHEFRRFGDVKRAAGEAMGWLQAWKDQVSEEQFRNDVVRARDERRG